MASIRASHASLNTKATRLSERSSPPSLRFQPLTAQRVSVHSAAALAGQGQGQNVSYCVHKPVQQEVCEGSIAGRRAFLQQGLLGAALCTAVQALTVARPANAADGAGQMLYVSPSGTAASSSSGSSSMRTFTSITDAVAAAPSGATIQVAAGRYIERFRLVQPITIEAAPGAVVEVVWESPRPYECVVEIDCTDSLPGSIVLRGMSLLHSSKSVANNYCVYIKSGAPLLERCDISSTSGAGVGVEGANPALLRCAVHDCARQGLALFGSAEDPLAPAGGSMQECDIHHNALDGVLVRGGAAPDLLRNTIHDNGGYGVSLQDASGRYEGNTVYSNKRGSISVTASFDLDLDLLRSVNSLSGLLSLDK